MLSPCNNKNQAVFNPNFSPTLWARVTSCNIIPTPEMYEKRKIIYLSHNYQTNGPGINSSQSNKELPININDIQINNIIYKIPCLFLPYIDEIKTLVSQKYNFKYIFAYLVNKYGIVNMQTTKPMRLIRQYNYITAPSNITNYQNGGIYSKPYLLAEKVYFNPLPPTFEFINNIIALINDANHFKVSTNDGKNYTNIIEHLLPGGRASYWGSKLTTEDRPFKLAVLIRTITTNIFVPGLIVYTGILQKLIYFIPTVSANMLLTYKSIPENTPVTLKILKFIDIQIDNECKYIPYRLPFANEF
jgi:hypothetical protein